MPQIDSVKAQIRSEVEQIRPLDDKERQDQANTMKWIDSGSELYRIEKPAIPPKHLIAYFAVVDGDYLLLVDHINAGCWLPTGGHVDKDEHPRQTVIREAREELNIEAVFLRESPAFLTVSKTGGNTAGHTDVSLWYVLKGNRQDHFEYDQSEFTQIQWFHRKHLPLHRTDPEMHRFAAKLIQVGIWPNQHPHTEFPPCPS